MDPATEASLRELVRGRLQKQAPEIARSLQQIAAGNPLGSEPREERLVARIATKANLSRRDAQAVADAVAQKATRIVGGLKGAIAAGHERKESAAEARQGLTIDLVGVEFLTRGRLAANTVGRISYRSGRAWGSGFLVGPGLFLTNNHVISSPDAARLLVVEFDYENDDAGLQRPVTTFALDPDKCFINDPTDRLDFALVAIGKRLAGSKPIEAFGFNPLSAASDKHMLGEIANLIQHPEGRLKQLVVRENNLVSRDETAQVLHYLADTEKGASGSPVCNNEWEPIALHHWGEPALEVNDMFGSPLRSDVNEGVRISAIVKSLRDRIGSLDSENARSVSGLFSTWSSLPRSGPAAPSQEAAAVASESRSKQMPESKTQGSVAAHVKADGTVTWTLPIELSVRLPWATQQPAGDVAGSHLVLLDSERSEPRLVLAKKKSRVAEAAEDFSDRNGYEPGFLPGHVVPLPDCSGLAYRLARNQVVLPGEDPHELRYHHFSIVMNADRRLAAFTACNIDGRRSVAVNRQDKTTKLDPTPKDLGVESMDGAEASDDFSPDPRILASEQMAIEFYKNQKVPGFELPTPLGSDPTPEEKKAHSRKIAERTARMFQKGHITLRGDPAWGTSDQAVLAEADTFFYTNAAPQMGFFNQGSPDNHPGAKGKLRWRAVESYVLRNAVTMRQRVSVFAGPVFDDEYDVRYRFDSKVPMRFWKLVVWKAPEGLRSIALLADQKPVLETLGRGTPESMEVFDDDDELARVTEFLSTVPEIERLTGLRFSAEVRDGDVRAGGDSGPAGEFLPDVLRQGR